MTWGALLREKSDESVSITSVHPLSGREKSDKRVYLTSVRPLSGMWAYSEEKQARAPAKLALSPQEKHSHGHYFPESLIFFPLMDIMYLLSREEARRSREESLRQCGFSYR